MPFPSNLLHPPLPLNAPHTPIVPSKEWQGKSSLGAYGDFVMETDWAVGEVLAAIDHAGVSGNTLVIVTSDNGCSKAAGIPQLQAQGQTLTAAESLELEDRIGSLEVGKDGDVAVFEKHPLDSTTKCLLTIIEGEVFFDYARDSITARGGHQ